MLVIGSCTDDCVAESGLVAGSIKCLNRKGIDVVGISPSAVAAEPATVCFLTPST